jgi:hypothetical protein
MGQGTPGPRLWVRQVWNQILGGGSNYDVEQTPQPTVAVHC